MPVPPQQTPYNRGYDDNYGNSNYQNNNIYYLNDMLRDTDRRIKIAIRRRQISPYEAQNLVAQLNYIQEKKYRYSRNGFIGGYEQQELMNDLRNLNNRIDFNFGGRERFGQNFNNGHHQAFGRGRN